MNEDDLIGRSAKAKQDSYSNKTFTKQQVTFKTRRGGASTRTNLRFKEANTTGGRPPTTFYQEGGEVATGGGGGGTNAGVILGIHATWGAITPHFKYGREALTDGGVGVCLHCHPASQDNAQNNTQDNAQNNAQDNSGKKNRDNPNQEPCTANLKRSRTRRRRRR